MHGGQGDYRSWQPQLAAFTPLRVIAYSRRYHFPNINAMTTAHSARADADDLAALVAALQLGPAERRNAVMENARFFRALTASADPFPQLDKDAVRRLRIPILAVRGERPTRYIG